MNILLLKDKIPTELVKIHTEAFDGFFLTSLGEKFLKLYYKTVLHNPKGIIVSLLNDENKLIGFAAGTVLSKGFHKEILLNNFIAYSINLFRICIFRPKFIIRLLKNMSKKTNNQVDDGWYAELLSIGISPKYEGKGYGKLLLEKFEDELIKQNVKKNTLTTDFYDNDNVLNFYKKMGYNILDEFIAYPNRKMYKLIKLL